MGDEGGFTFVVSGYLLHAVGQDAVALALGVEEGDDVALLHVLDVDLLDEDEVAGLDHGIRLRVHRRRQNDQRGVPAHGRDFIRVDQPLDDDRHVYYEDRHKEQAEDNADDRPDPSLFLFLFSHYGSNLSKDSLSGFLSGIRPGYFPREETLRTVLLSNYN